MKAYAARQTFARMLVADFTYRCGQMAYREIAEALGMNHCSAVVSIIRRLKILCQENKHLQRLENKIQHEMALNQTCPLCSTDGCLVTAVGGWSVGVL